MKETLICPPTDKIFDQEWNDILEEIAFFRRNSMSKWIWFRGHSNKDYKLDSGLFRIENKKLDINDYQNIEERLFTSFKNQSSTFIRENFLDLHFHMQHHGLKTRLLDWSDSLATALYFAFEGWNYDSGNEACIWLLDPFALNKNLHGINHILTTDSLRIAYECNSILDLFYTNMQNKYDKTMFVKNSFAIYPPKNNSRLLLQNGYFTVQSNCLKDLEMEIDRICPNNKDVILKKIDLPTRLLESIYEYLTLNGINSFSIFSDADGLSQYLNKEITENAYNPRLKEIAKFNS